MAEFVATFDPDVILFVGLFSPLTAPLFTHRPMVAMSVQSGPPIAPADVILSADDDLAGRTLRPWGPALPPTYAHPHPFRLSAKPAASGVRRADLAIAESAVVLIMVGYRLGYEIKDDFAEQLRALMARRANVVLMLVGAPELPAGLQGAPADQLRVLAARNDIGDLLACSDIFVNPPRPGGGFSVAEAMAAGLAIVSLADGDGGDKVGPLAAADDQTYWARLETYIDDPSARQRDGERLRARFAARLDIARSGPSLMAACAEAVVRFNARRTPPIAPRP